MVAGNTGFLKDAKSTDMTSVHKVANTADNMMSDDIKTSALQALGGIPGVSQIATTMPSLEQRRNELGLNENGAPIKAPEGWSPRQPAPPKQADQK